MGKIAFFNIPAWGHLSPTLPVVRELVQRGETVHYYISEEYADRVSETTGAEIRNVPRRVDFPVNKLPRSILALGSLLLQQSALWLPEALPQIKEEQYDVVLYDRVCCWGRFVSELLSIPAMGSYCTVFGMLPKEPMGPIGLRFIVPEVLDFPMYFKMRSAARTLKKQYNLDRLGMLDLLTNVGEKNIVFTSRELLPFGEKVGPDFRFVGPCFFDRGNMGDVPFDDEDTRPIVYVSLGTVVDDAPAFYRACLNAFKDEPIRVYMSIGRKTAVEEVGEIPSNFIVRNFMPQIEILKRAKLFISHGGLGSVQESLYYNVPLLMWTQNPEHAWNARCVVDNGAGEILTQSDLAATRLLDRVRTALNNSTLQAKATALGESMRQAGGQIAAVEEIQNFVQKHTAPPLTPAGS